MDTTTKKLIMIFFFVMVFYLMTVLSSILIPLTLAVLFAILCQPLIAVLKKIKVPDWLILPTVSVITLGIIFGLINIIVSSVSELTTQQDFLLSRLDLRLEELLGWINSRTGFSLNPGAIFKEFNSMLQSEWLSNTAGSLAQKLSSFTGSFIMFALYYVVLLTSMSGYKRYIRYVGGEENRETFLKNFEKVKKSIVSYMLIKTLINLTLGLWFFFICSVFGIKFAFLWGLITFMIYYIPSIGSILALIPPSLMAIIQFDSINTIILLIICLAVVGFIVGNFIEPKIMGNRLRLNTLTVIFGLVFWGYLWGIPGMMLSVPLLVILKLILEHLPSLNVFARIMGYPEGIG